MTQDEIIEMAKEAGLIVNSPYLMPHDNVLRGIEAFAKLVAAKEREALLNVVYGYASSLSWNEDFQADIRARGEA